MSISTAITDLSNRIQNAFDACEAKGATMPVSKTTWSLSNTIESIPAGGGSQFGLSLSNFWTLDDNGNLGAPTEVVDVVFDGVKSIEANAFNTGIFNMQVSKCNPHLRNVTFPDLIDIAAGALRYAFVSQTQLSNITFSSLLSASGDYCCAEAFSNAVHINLPELKSVTGAYAFQVNSTNNRISSFYAPKLETINASSPFQGLLSPNAVELNLSSVKYVSGSNALLFFNTNQSNYQLTSFNIDSLSVAIGQQGLGNMLYQQSNITGDFELPQLVLLSGTNVMFNAFRGTNISKITFNSLSSAIGNTMFSTAFAYNPTLKRVDFPKLEQLNFFTALGSAQFNQALANTTDVEMHFDKLSSLTGGTTAGRSTFNGCTGLAKIYFNSLQSITNDYLFNGCTSLTEIHFASAYQSSIESSTGYATLWGRGAGAATVYFDL